MLRRHASLLDFLTRAAYSAQRWLPHDARRERMAEYAAQIWGPGKDSALQAA